jgi:ketosteroid isomerase-like protein
MTTRTSLAVVAGLAVAACAPSLIAGTDIQDTRENRAVYGVVRAYAAALQKKDAAAVLELVAPDYFDNGGTPQADDDMDRAALEKALPADLARVDSLKVELGVKKIVVQGDEADADIFYDGYYRVVTPAGPVPKRESDLQRMHLKKVAGAWKIASGL